MFRRAILLMVSGSALTLGCANQLPLPSQTQEIISNLAEAGFPADDITVVDDVVYVGNDAEVSLAASREMLQASDSTKEQYRTTNTISTSLSKICINDDPKFAGVFSTALDLAIQNYDGQPLTFAMARAPSTGCSFTINAVIASGVLGGFSGFPSNGLPFPTINIGDRLSTYSVDTIEHVITHEIGHTIGFRHSDFFNRSISCGSGGSEGDAGVGAIHIAGTPTGAAVGQSIMNSCFRTLETGEFTSSDVTALKTMYGMRIDLAFNGFDGSIDRLFAATGNTVYWQAGNQFRRGVVNGGGLTIDLAFDGFDGTDRLFAASDNAVYWQSGNKLRRGVVSGGGLTIDLAFDGFDGSIDRLFAASGNAVYWQAGNKFRRGVVSGGGITIDLAFDGFDGAIDRLFAASGNTVYWQAGNKFRRGIVSGGGLTIDLAFDGFDGTDRLFAASDNAVYWQSENKFRRGVVMSD